MPYVKAFLCQASDEASTLDDAIQGLMMIFNQIQPQPMAA
jgi:hypothetical protein